MSDVKKSPKRKVITVKQQRVANLIKKGGYKTKGEVIAKAGYPKSMLKDPSKVFNSAGVQMALAKLGVTPESIMGTLKEAQNANVVVVHKGKATESEVPDHRLRSKVAVDMAEITGMKKLHIRQETVNVNVDMEDVGDLFG